MLLQYLAGLAVIQIPELDVSVPRSHKVGAVLRERHTRHFTRHLVGCDNDVFLQENTHTTIHVTVTQMGGGAGYEIIRSVKYLPRPHVHHHVMLVSHADDVFTVGGEGHARDAIFVLLELGHLSSLGHVPQSHCREVTTLGKWRGMCVDIWSSMKKELIVCVHYFTLKEMYDAFSVFLS